MKIYIGEFEGNHWAVDESVYDYANSHIKGRKSVTDYLLKQSILCSDSLVRGLKVGDVLPPCESKKQILLTARDGEKWVDASSREYEIRQRAPERRRIILVPVTDKPLPIRGPVEGRVPVEAKQCPNCKETEDGECACIRNKCTRCNEPVGNITFTVCDNCWQDGRPKVEAKQEQEYIGDKIKKEMNGFQIYNHPARKIFDAVCWRLFGMTFDSLCDNPSNQQSGFWLQLILPAMEEYKATKPQEQGEDKPRLFTMEDLRDAIRFGADRANIFCGMPSELEKYLTEEEKEYVKTKFGITL